MAGGTRLTRKPGELRVGSGSLSMRRLKARTSRVVLPEQAGARTTAISGIFAIGLKKRGPTRRPGFIRPAVMRYTRKHDVSVAGKASRLTRGSNLVKKQLIGVKTLEDRLDSDVRPPQSHALIVRDQWSVAFVTCCIDP
jgi:hypothetical protein